MDENNYNQQQGNQYNPQPEPQYTQQPGQYANQQNQYNAQQYSAQQPPFGNQYNQPPVQHPFYPPYDPTTKVMSVGEYVGMFILSSIPVVNIICWIVWLCSQSTNKNKKNYVIANIVLWVISIVALIIVSVIFSALGISLANYY